MRDLDSRANLPSPMGGQLQKLRDGTMEIKSGNPFRHEEQSHMTAMRLLVWNSISEFEQRVISAKNSPIRWDYRFRVVPECDLIPDTQFEPPVYLTKLGEEIAVEQETRDPPAAGFRIVRSPKPVFPRNHEIAKMLGVSERSLRVIVGNAYAALEQHELFDLVMQ